MRDAACFIGCRSLAQHRQRAARRSRRTPYPNKPIRLVVPFTPGGVTDTSGRVDRRHLGKRLGQQVIVDNKPGASRQHRHAAGRDRAPDGYTLVLGFDGTMVINPHVFAKVPFDTLQGLRAGRQDRRCDADPGGATRTARRRHLQRPDRAFEDPAGGLSYGTSGTGGTPHIAGELLEAAHRRQARRTCRTRAAARR